MMTKIRCSSQWYLLILVISLVLLSACNSSASNSSSGSNSNSEEVITLRMNSLNVPPVDPETPSYTAQIVFPERVEEETNGRVKIEVFYNNQLAGQSESLDALARGTFDMQVITPAAWGEKIPEANWASLPYAWLGEEHLNYLIRESEVGELFSEALEDYGVKPLFYYHSSGSGYLSNKPISKPEDMNGVVMSAVGVLKPKFYEAMGAGNATVPTSDYYEALLRGTIDGTPFPYYALDTMKLSEVVKYVSAPAEIDPATAVIVINKQTWDDLPADIQETIMKVALEVEQETMKQSYAKTIEGLEFAKDNGLEIVKISRDDYSKFVEVAKEHYWKQFGESNERTAKMIEIIEQSLNEWLEKPEGEEFFNKYTID